MTDKINLHYSIVVIPTPLLCTTEYCAACKFKKLGQVLGNGVADDKYYCTAFPTKAGHARVLQGTPVRQHKLCLNNTIHTAKMVS